MVNNTKHIDKMALISFIFFFDIKLFNKLVVDKTINIDPKSCNEATITIDI